MRVASVDPYSILGTVDVAMTLVKDPFSCAADIDAKSSISVICGKYQSLYFSKSKEHVRHFYMLGGICDEFETNWSNVKYL